MSNSFVLREIQSLDPVRDHQRIVYLSTCYDFPFDTTRALELALFRTFAVPAISSLLDHTGEFQRRAQKRYDDTDLIVSELMEHGYDSDRGRRALRRMNQLHGRFEIANDDFLYVLSTFIYEPIRWNARFGWRPLCEQERLGYFHFWCEIGRRMNIREIPADYDQYDEYNRRYEVRHFRPAKSNHRVATATREMFVRWFPLAPPRLTRAVIHALLDEPLRTAVEFPQSNRVLQWLVPAALKFRAVCLRWVPARRTPRLRTDCRHRTYPEGYVIESLGPDAVESHGDNALRSEDSASRLTENR